MSKELNAAKAEQKRLLAVKKVLENQNRQLEKLSKKT
jgi:hypothetical protein